MSDTPVTMMITFTPVDGQRDAFVEKMSALAARVHSEPGCEIYALYEGDDGSIHLFEKWSSAENLQAHLAGPAVAEMNTAFVGLIQPPVVSSGLRPLGSGERPATL